MSAGRASLLARDELRLSARRPLYWIWLAILGFTAWGLSAGNVRIQSGDSGVGGTKAFLTSEFALTQTLTYLVPLFYGFFLAVAAGMIPIRDREKKVGELLFATPLSVREYVWGRYLAALAGFIVVLLVHLALSAGFYHVGADAESAEFIGPFVAGNYLRPALFIALPTILFLSGASFAVGLRTDRPILVFVLPVAVLALGIFFLWSWSPGWLDPRWNRALMLVDPTGVRWLEETWLKVDRGVDFYNTARVAYDTPFLLSRLAFAALGPLAVAWAARPFARGLERVGKARRGAAPDESAPSSARALTLPAGRLGRLGFLAGTWAIARAELRELRSSPGLYLFIPLIVLETAGSATLAVGPFDTGILLTPGTLAVRQLGFLTTLTCFLLLFYTVESLRRERGCGLAPIAYSAPLPTTAWIAGKAAANALVAAAVIAATLLTSLIVLAVQGDVPIALGPFLLVWGVLLVPTLVAWSAFVGLTWALLRSRYTTYAVGLAVLAWTGYELAAGDLDWVGNWPLWGALVWSDLSTFQLDRAALVLSRSLVLAVAALCVVLAAKRFPRRASSITRWGYRLRPRAWRGPLLRLAPFLLLPLVLAGRLDSLVDAGVGGDAAEKAGKDYWRKNVATFSDYPLPDIARAEVAVDLDPAERGLVSRGTLELVNRTEEALRWIPLTYGRHWREVEWTLDGEVVEPEDREHLAVFEPGVPVPPDGSVTVGFSFEGTFPDGITRRGGGASEFVLPGGVVLTSFSPSFVPVVGYSDSVGVDEDNRYDAKEWAPDFFEGVTRSGFGQGAPFPARVTITGPADFTLNSVGRRVSDEVAEGRRTTVWETDEPVMFFNIVAGRWDERRGEGTVVYHSAAHPWNVESMGEALDAARKWYSEWFLPFPWEELKLSEFPGLAGYAQGFPTNITFSESIGFLADPDPERDAPFLVTAHESAHQWWGNLLVPGEGPGGNVLSEGMSHFSTILLVEQVRGLRQRIEVAKDFERSYARSRQVDSERPLVRMDGSRPGDQTVTYDKGGWVTWMLLHHMGRENLLAGLSSFIAHYRTDRDHPVLQDLVRHLRPYAPDAEAYDAFTRQWFFEVVCPEYRLSDVEREEVRADGSAGSALVRGTLENAGTGTMPVEVCASRGERFPDEDAEDPEPYLEVRATLVLGAGETAAFELDCPFEPERVLVDPDAVVLQLRREQAIHRF